MRNTILLCLLCISFICCSKKDNTVDDDIPRDIPTWLQTRIAEIKKNDQSNTYRIGKYKISGVVYYNISLIYQSCMLCDVYNEAGEKVTPIPDAREAEFLGTVWPVIP
ncbi:hypothetical protein ACTJIJ_00755 [Niabella sp. 22666]|uniref:hypothetical protein n=1 Tax=Niabella sp. 22666 TaxID=3453954 RepID=UPI003F83E5DA